MQSAALCHEWDEDQIYIADYKSQYRTCICTGLWPTDATGRNVPYQYENHPYQYENTYRGGQK